MADLVEGDMVRVRGGAGQASREAVFLQYVGSRYGTTGFKPKHAMVCWFLRIDPSQMRASARRVLVKNITSLERQHPAYELSNKWSNKVKDRE